MLKILISFVAFFSAAAIYAPPKKIEKNGNINSNINVPDYHNDTGLWGYSVLGVPTLKPLNLNLHVGLAASEALLKKYDEKKSNKEDKDKK